MDDFGGTDRLAVLDAEGLKLCYKVLEAIPFKDPLLYARCDLMRDNDGKWVLGELEIIEPSLFFRHYPPASDAFAQAVHNSLLGKITQKPTNLSYKEKKTNFDYGLIITGISMYILSIPIMFGVAYRLYWRFGDFSSSEHNTLLISTFILTAFSWLSHLNAHFSDPGWVKPWHFREHGKLYKVQGRENEEIKLHGQIEVKSEIETTFSEFSECPLCQCIKI
jgi:hypothetical protein